MESQLRSGRKYKPKTIVFYDLETTGFNPYHDDIIEIGAIKIINNKITKFNRLVNINKSLPKKISEITKISDFDLKGQPKIDVVLKEFLEFIIEDSNDVYLIAHNNDSFDRLFLENAFSNCKISLDCNIKYIDMALEITDANFDELVLKSDKPVMVDFWAEWCGPCRMLGPIIEEVSNDYEGKAVVGKLDVDSNQEFAAKFGVRNIPTVLVFNGGELVKRQVGVSPKNVYTESLDELL